MRLIIKHQSMYKKSTALTAMPVGPWLSSCDLKRMQKHNLLHAAQDLAQDARGVLQSLLLLLAGLVGAAPSPQRCVRMSAQ